MRHEFLKGFEKRMKTVGRYCLLFSNIGRRDIWKRLELETLDSQVNLIFAVLLYIMEQSLKEENCTLDDISVYLEDLDERYFQLGWTREDCQVLADTVVNVVLGNEGLLMFYEGYNFEQASPVSLHISYVANRVIYPEGEGRGDRKTSYYLTEEGYSLLLGTLEVEDNLKLTIQEMIFKLHLEKQSYDKALDDVKNVFNLLRIQIQKIAEAMNVIRHNVLDYQVDQYESITREDMETIRETNEKFKGYRETVQARVKELEESRIDRRILGEKEEENLTNLRDIEGYLTRAIDLHMSILHGHFDLQGLYALELGRVADLQLVQRFSLRRELYDKILQDPRKLGNMDIFLKPLFTKAPPKSYNLAKAAIPQATRRGEDEEDEEEMEDFDPESYRMEQRRLEMEKKLTYRRCLECLLDHLARGETKLSQVAKSLDGEERRRFLPSAQIFKEVIVELLTVRTLDVEALRRERAQNLDGDLEGFHLAESLWSILDARPDWDRRLKRIEVVRLFEQPMVVIPHVPDERGGTRTIRCQDAAFTISWEDDNGL